MQTTLSPALEYRHRAAVADAVRAAADAMSFAKLRRLRSSEPAQTLPAGLYECWPTSAGLSIVHIGRAGVSGEHALRQIWPPVQEVASHA